MIYTKNFKLTRNIYANIIIGKRLKKSWWIYTLMVILGVLYLPKFGKDHFSTFFIIFSFLYPLAIIIYLWLWANSKGHQPIFSETKLSFDESFLYFERDNNETKLNPATIQNTISRSDYWLLYISKGQFIYIPKNIFFSQEDYSKFSKMIN